MSELNRIVAAHPLSRFKPYNAIKFARFDGMGTPLYTVAKSKKPVGAKEALREALSQLGGKCFHCKVYMPPQPLSHDCTRDHVRPKKDGGRDFLHNLVIACGRCNRSKAAQDLVLFRPESGAAYLKALDEHLIRCLGQLAKAELKD